MALFKKAFSRSGAIPDGKDGLKPAKHGGFLQQVLARNSASGASEKNPSGLDLVDTNSSKKTEDSSCGEKIEDFTPSQECSTNPVHHMGTLCVLAIGSLQARNTYDNILREFKKVLEHDGQTGKPATAAVLEGNFKCNRYCDVVPYDENRVVLSSPRDYINASYVHDLLDPAPITRYVASQGPLPGTIYDFWVMVMDVNCSAIVMLTNFAEEGKSKCVEYFPSGDQGTVNYGGIEVTTVHTSLLTRSVTFRQLEVVNTETNVCRWINHYQYHGWPDFGVPKTARSMRALCHALDGCRKADAHIVVHCSAGIGRSGVFCTVDIALQRIEKMRISPCSYSHTQLRQMLDIQSIVMSLREQRMGMVQTSEQYKFCYDAVLEELKRVQTKCLAL